MSVRTALIFSSSSSRSSSARARLRLAAAKSRASSCKSSSPATSLRLRRNSLTRLSIRLSMRASAALSEGVLGSSMIALMSVRAACASLSISAPLASYSCLRSLYPASSGGSCIFAITMRRSARARSSDKILIRVRCALAGLYLAVSSSSRWPTRPTMIIDSTDVATMRMINPTAMATIRLLIDCLITDPENFFRLRVRIFEMSRPPGEG